jgi:hypothetical protein
MLIRDIFDTPIEDTIEPVIKVAERQDEHKLAGEIGSYVVTPTLERYLDDFLEQFTDTFRRNTTEIGVWISGYFGSGKSHLAKIAALLIENRNLEGVAAAKRFEARVPSQATHRDSILRSLSVVPQCRSQVLAFNLNTLADSKVTPLPRLLLSQYYLSKGYGGNFIYARVIEAELDKRGVLADLHAIAERLARKPWAEIQKNLGFYSKALYQAACEAASDVFSTPEEVAQALKNAEKGELYNVQFLVETILEDLKAKEKALKKPCRLVLVLDESGQWIEDDAGRLAQLQALVEEAAQRGQGKIWIFVTTHEDMGSIYQNARALRGDMKKIEGRFRFKFSLTTENIELVLEDRLFKKTLAGKAEVARTYNENPGVLRDLGQLANTSQKLPECSEDRFNTFYPFFPYQIHLIPEIVKRLRSAGGRGEQLSGSTRTLLAITQDILRIGRRGYLDAAIGEVVSFDEVYNNLAGEGEVSPDVRRELGRIEEVVPGATLLTRRLAEVLYLIREIAFVPRTIDNLARLLVEHTTDDLATIIGRIRPELERLIRAKLVAPIGEEYEFLTGERRTFEEEVQQEAADLRWQDLEAGLAAFATPDVIGFQTVPYRDFEFPIRITLDGTRVAKDGFVEVRITSPLAALAGTKVSDLEDQSLRPEEAYTLFVLCDRIPGFDGHLKRFLAMRRVVDRWKGDPQRSAEAHKLAAERETKDLDTLKGKVVAGIRDGLRRAQVVYKGSARAVTSRVGQLPGEVLRADLAGFWPTLYSKFAKVPVRIVNEQKAVVDVLKGAKDLAADVRALKLYDQAGQLDPHCPLIDEIRVYLSGRQERKERTLGKDLIAHFERPNYGWDPGAVRVGMAALVRAAAVKVVIGKKPYTNPADEELQHALRVGRDFDKVELILEESEVDVDTLTEVRSLLMKLTKKRKIDETPAALAAEMEDFGKGLLAKAGKTALWAEPARLPLPAGFGEGKDACEKILALTSPVHRIKEIHARKDNLESDARTIDAQAAFVEKWGKAFTQMSGFSICLEAVEHRLPRGGAAVSFLDNWRTAMNGATVTEPDVWKALQNGQAGAGLELESALASWREEARLIARAALDRLPHDLASHGLAVEPHQAAEAAPLADFITKLDEASSPAKVAALPDRARGLVLDLGDHLRDRAEAQKAKPEKAEEQTRVERPVRRIRIADLAAYGRIRDVAEWTVILRRIDEAVRKALQDDHDVEIL